SLPSSHAHPRDLHSFPTRRSSDLVKEIAERFSKSTATVVTEYRGLTTAQLAELRRALGPNTTYRVAKNTLVKRAAEQSGVEGLEDRKSTRLNSSHVKISYAVFCLK